MDISPNIIGAIVFLVFGIAAALFFKAKALPHSSSVDVFLAISFICIATSMVFFSFDHVRENQERMAKEQAEQKAKSK